MLSGLEQSAMLGRWPRGKVIVVLMGYFDESGEHSAGDNLLRRLTLGGYFARWEDVKSLCERWRAALDSEGLAEFHMSEIASDEHRFSEWDKPRQERLLKFADILADCALEFGAFSYPVTKPEAAWSDTYELALNRALMTAGELAERTGDSVHVVFAQSSHIGAGRIGEYFDRLSWQDYLSGYSVKRSKNEPALQAAEIAARGLKRIMQDGTITASFKRIALTKKPFQVWPEAAAIEQILRTAQSV